MAEPRGAILKELVIVVLGVLIALAADSWMDGLRRRESAESALGRLRRDVAADVSQMDSVYLPRLAGRGRARDRLGLFIMGSGAITDSVGFVQDVQRASYYTTFDANTAAFDDLRNSGNLGLIADADLRNAILSYYNTTLDVGQIDELQRGTVLLTTSRLIPAIVGGLAWPGTVSDTDVFTVSRMRAATALDAAEIRSSDRLRELLVATGEFYDMQRFQYERVRSRADALLLMLDAASARF